MFSFYIPEIEDYVVRILGAVTENDELLIVCVLSSREEIKLSLEKIAFYFENFRIPF